MSKSLRWALAISLLALIGSGLVIAFMLSLTSERDLFERNFVWLFWVNLVVAAALLLVIAIAAARLWLRLRSGKFGSKLLIKLAGIFALVGVVPGVLIYTVSVQFVSRSIETWFDVQVAGALDAGLALGRGTLEALERRPGVQHQAGGRAPVGDAAPIDRAADAGARARADRCARRDAARPPAARCWRRRARRPARSRRRGRRRSCCARRAPPARRASSKGWTTSRPPAAHARRVRVRALVPSRATRSASRRARSASCRWCSRCRRSWWPMRWRCRTRTANTSSARSPARACAACTSAR